MWGRRHASRMTFRKVRWRWDVRDRRLKRDGRRANARVLRRSQANLATETRRHEKFSLLAISFLGPRSSKLLTTEGAEEFRRVLTEEFNHKVRQECPQDAKNFSETAGTALTYGQGSVRSPASPERY